MSRARLIGLRNVFVTSPGKGVHALPLGERRYPGISSTSGCRYCSSYHAKLALLRRTAEPSRTFWRREAATGPNRVHIHNLHEGSLRHRNFSLSSALANPRPIKAHIPESYEEAQRIIQDAKKQEETKEEEGFHPYKNLCPWKSKSELANFLIENMIYNENGLFVTNKPFGVGVLKPPAKNKPNPQMFLHLRGISTSPYCLEDVLPNLKDLLGKPDLVLVKSTEKLTSGVAVFAEDEKTGSRFSKALKSSKGYYDIVYKYHVITVLPPMIRDSSKTERVGVTIKQGVGQEVGQPVILHEYSINSVKRRDTIAVHVQPKLVKVGLNGGYLVEIHTSSVTSNFLRIYSADLLAPILGDHLYSCRVQTLKGIPTKIDPTHLLPGTSNQKLPKGYLELLKFNSPEDSIRVPYHAHLRSYKVRKFLGKAVEIEFEAPYPPHFHWTCEQFGIPLNENAITETVSS